MSNLKNQITEDMKNAMRAKEAGKLLAIRMLLAAIKQKEIDERIEVTDAQVLSIIEKQIKQRKDSIAQFTTAGRDDLVVQEQFELNILQAYQPAQMSEEQVRAAVAAAVAQTGAKTPQDMGKLMAVLKPALAGKADMGMVSIVVKAALTA